MNIKSIAQLNAIVFLILGIAFALYGPLMIDFFGVLEVPGASGESYWFTASFARLYGAALFGFGFVVWAITGVTDQLPPPALRKISLGLLLTHLVGLMVAFTQQYIIWLKPFGWLLAGMYLLFMAGYAFLLARERDHAG